MNGMTRNTIRNYRKTWIDNLKENVKTYDFFEKDASKLKAFTYEEPAFLVGASPSLSKNIDELKNKKGTIFASAHSLKYLLKHGIKPDFVILVDAQKRSLGYIAIGDKSKDLTLLIDICVSPDILKAWKGAVWFFRGTHGKNIDKYVDKITDFKNKITTGGSVISTSTILALSLGLKNIVFVGNDFSFPKDNYYAKSIPIKEKDGESIVHSVDRCYTYDISGKKIDTVTRFFMTKIFLDFLSASMADIKFINATEGGILGAYKEGNLKSMKQVPLKEVN
jgi:hypothetical protein